MPFFQYTYQKIFNNSLPRTVKQRSLTNITPAMKTARVPNLQNYLSIHIGSSMNCKQKTNKLLQKKRSGPVFTTTPYNKISHVIYIYISLQGSSTKACSFRNTSKHHHPEATSKRANTKKHPLTSKKPFQKMQNIRLLQLHQSPRRHQITISIVELSS